jgi:hypothetical protein
VRAQPPSARRFMVLYSLIATCERHDQARRLAEAL